MQLALYISHPEVNIDPHVPVPLWGLSAVGRERAKHFAARMKFPRGTVLFSSEEAKAGEVAQWLSVGRGIPVQRVHDMGENDRSATGFLAPDEFDAMVARFYANPDQGPDGWESARAAQDRIVAEVRLANAGHAAAPMIVFCGHGGVGTLLKSYLGRRPISQQEDQRELAHAGGGNVFAFDLDKIDDLALDALLCDWTPMEQFEGYDQWLTASKTD